MRSSYRGYEITVNRERSLGGDMLMYWTIVRESDGRFFEDTFYDGAETVREFVQQLKTRVDGELDSDDPWNESGTYDMTPWFVS